MEHQKLIAQYLETRPTNEVDETQEKFPSFEDWQNYLVHP